MSNNRTKRLRPAVLQDDLNTFTALQALSDYQPANPDYAVAKGLTIKTAMEAKQAEHVQIMAQADSVRDEMVALEWDFHDFDLGAKDQVKAQYGKSSNELQSLGLKKKSEYKSGGRRKPSGNSEGTT